MSQEKTTSLGGRLRQAREGRGLSLSDAQSETGVSLKVLSDLEEGRCEAVEPVFGRMALRTYADFLGLDGAQAEKQFLVLFGGAPPPPPRDRTQGSTQNKKKKASGGQGALWGGVALVVLAVAAWVLWAQFGGGGDTNTEPVAEQTIAAGPRPSAPTDSETGSETDSETDSELDSALTSALTSEPDSEASPAFAAVSSAAIPGTGQETGPADPAPTRSLQTNSAENIPAPLPVRGDPATAVADSLELAVEGVDSTWVRVSGDGALLFEGIIPPAGRRSWRAAREFRVRSGWAHGLRYRLGGELLGGGRLGSATRMLRFRATHAGVTLLGADLQPLTDPAP